MEVKGRKRKKKRAMGSLIERLKAEKPGPPLEQQKLKGSGGGARVKVKKTGDTVNRAEIHCSVTRWGGEISRRRKEKSKKTNGPYCQKRKKSDPITDQRVMEKKSGWEKTTLRKKKQRWFRYLKKGKSTMHQAERPTRGQT